MAGVDEKVCAAQHKALNGAFQSIRETQESQKTSLEKLEEGQQTIIEGICGDPAPGGAPGLKTIAYSNQKWIKRFLVILGAVAVAALTTLTTLTVTYLWKGNTNEVPPAVSGSVHVDPVD